MTNIKPIDVDGELLCSGSICELYHDVCDNTGVGACKGNDGRSICVAGLRKQRAELKEQVESMKCCGNCPSFRPVYQTCNGNDWVVSGNHVCDEWELPKKKEFE